MPYKNPEEAKTRTKRYYQANKEKIISYERLRRQSQKYKDSEKERYKKRRLDIDYVEKARVRSKKHTDKNKQKNSEKFKLLYVGDAEFKRKHKERNKRYSQKIEVRIIKRQKIKEYTNRPDVKEKIKIKQNSFAYKEYHKKYRQLEKVKEKALIKRKTDDYKKKVNLWFKNRLKTSVNFKLRTLISSRVAYAIKTNAKIKKTTDLLGCTIEDFRVYLEKRFVDGMSWDNWKFSGGWHLDHIIPCSAFDLSTLKAQEICFNHSNLQPLWGSENLKKNQKVDDAVLKELYEKGIINNKYLYKFKT